jgi:hypothetical protein
MPGHPRMRRSTAHLDRDWTIGVRRAARASEPAKNAGNHDRISCILAEPRKQRVVEDRKARPVTSHYTQIRRILSLKELISPIAASVPLEYRTLPAARRE